MRFEEVVSVPIRDIEYRKPVVVAQSAHLADVTDQMAGQNRGVALINSDRGTLAGIFTEHDLARRIDLDNDDWRTRRVGEFMTEAPKTAALDASIREALKLMTSGRFRHLPLVDDKGVAVGVLSIRDILMHIAGCFPKHFLNLPPDPDHETRGRWGG